MQVTVTGFATLYCQNLVFSAQFSSLFSSSPLALKSKLLLRRPSLFPSNSPSERLESLSHSGLPPPGIATVGADPLGPPPFFSNTSVAVSLEATTARVRRVPNMSPDDPPTGAVLTAASPLAPFADPSFLESLGGRVLQVPPTLLLSTLASCRSRFNRDSSCLLWSRRMAILASILDVCWRSLVAPTVRESVAVEFEPRCADSDLLPADWDCWLSPLRRASASYSLCKLLFR